MNTSITLLTDPGILAPHFCGSEFRCSCGCNRIFVASRLVHFLEEARSHYARPLLVSSGYRCPPHNASLNGSAPRSYHTLGMAADVAFPGLTVANYAGWFNEHWVAAERGGLIIYRTFIHVDQGRPRLLHG